MLQDPVLLFCNGGPCKVNCFPHGITGPEMGVNLEDADTSGLTCIPSHRKFTPSEKLYGYVILRQ